ncbi:MAG TPA: hypothetical protein VKY81_10720 [Natronosporangium sp.]|nr:hypothetical protein [Natronosporangium sp.]
MIRCHTHRHATRSLHERITRLIHHVEDLTRLAVALRRLLWQLLGIAIVGTVILAVLTGRATTVLTGLPLPRLFR